MSTVKTNTGEKNTRTNWAFLCAGLPFIVQWCRNVKDAECPPDTLALRPGEGLSSLYSGCHNTAQAQAGTRGGQAGGQAGGRASSERSAGNMIIIRGTWTRSSAPVRWFDNFESLSSEGHKTQTQASSGPCEGEKKDTSRHHHHQSQRGVRRGHRRSNTVRRIKTAVKKQPAYFFHLRINAWTPAVFSVAYLPSFVFKTSPSALRVALIQGSMHLSYN